MGGCGAGQPCQHFLQGEPPSVFTLQLAWESHRESGADIAATMAVVREARTPHALPQTLSGQCCAFPALHGVVWLASVALRAVAAGQTSSFTRVVIAHFVPMRCFVLQRALEDMLREVHGYPWVANMHG